MLYDQHIAASHPEFRDWGRRWRRSAWLTVGSSVALVFLDLIYLRSLNQNFQYLVLAYLFGTLFLMILRLWGKERAFRDAWKETHPATSNQNGENIPMTD